MPTQPDPESPFVDAQVQAALGGREPGTPTTTGKPGVQAGGISFPAPPGVNKAPAGKPPAPSIPAPLAPQVQAPAATTPSAVGPGMPAEKGEASPATSAGQPMTVESPEQAATRYREAVVQTRNRLGPMPRIFRNPNLPEMEILVDKPNYNPFTNIWS